jgi:predicted nucleic acid-binding protein
LWLRKLARLVARGIVGGSAYDAIVAETARQSDLTLVTLDDRARATYEAVGVELELLA